ncbi:hypothetical protein NS206_04930 [Microbacterium testaceum]|uniref:hypothetical protein n=1 Tax=Microbacterium testaceum TaxID=2033 RepID=UPI00073406FF|nr:hypothetical protein [Microbacterium testaceum]KTS65288.1 hypothetical protein NS206_04930 [Microbacterium testaceum]KTS85125.1 hypothetical protein NS183_13375 [Microbacterium testaceum]
MGFELAIGVIGIAVAIIVPVWTFRKSNPKRQLRYRVEVTPLLTAGLPSSGSLQVLLDGHPVTNPQIVALTVWSDGRGDIDSRSFDAGRPLTFTVDAPIIETISAEPSAEVHLEVEQPDKLIIRPALLHRSFASTARVIVDGVPSVQPNYVLPGINVLPVTLTAAASAIETSRKKWRVTPLLISSAALLLGLLLLIVSFIIYAFDQKAYLPWGVVAILVIMLALLAVILFSTIRFFQWIGRNVEARSGLRR